MEKNMSLLVIDNDEKYGKDLVRCAVGRDKFISAEYAPRGDIGYELIKMIKPDVVIMDFMLPGLDALGILRRIKNDDSVDKPCIIVNSHAVCSKMVSVMSGHGVDYFMIKPQPPEEICQTVIDIMDVDSPTDKKNDQSLSENIDVTVTRFMHYIGIPAHLNGYSYIRSSLIIAMEDITKLTPITQKLYPQLAREYNKSPGSIERSIRHAIKVSWERGNKKFIKDIFGYCQDTKWHGCPSNSEYIAMAADDLKLRIRHNAPI